MTSEERLERSEWEVRTVLQSDALRLIRAWHYARGGPNTGVYRHGLYRRADGEILAGDPYGVALWLPPTRRAAEAVAGDEWEGVLSLSRLVCDPDAPRNAASFLMARSIRMIDADRWPVLVTWADRGQGHTGAIYKATNWREDGTTSDSDVWVDRHGRTGAA